MPIRRVKVVAYQLPYADWAQLGQSPPEDLAPLRPFWQKIIPENNEMLISEVFSDAIQDVHDVLDEDGKRINIYHMSIEDTMVRGDALCEELFQGDEVRVYFELTH